MLPSSREISKFRKLIFSWWRSNRRDLPWRHTHDPYKIFISEVMLQQTQVPRVLPKYTEFIEVFPSVYTLAKASPAQVLRIWKGMGYNRRALYLHQSAKMIVKEYEGKFPNSQLLLTQLPGVGLYTARAIMVFAFRQQVAAVDTNIKQIITFNFYNNIPQKDPMIQQTADLLVPRGKSWEWHQALMDYGSYLRQTSVYPKKIKTKVRQRVPFRQSNRFYRGRIIDLLRRKSIARSKLVGEIVVRYNKLSTEIENIIDDLKSDGLIEEEKRIIHLPV